MTERWVSQRTGNPEDMSKRTVGEEMEGEIEGGGRRERGRIK